MGWMSIGLEWTLVATSKDIHMPHRGVAVSPPVGQLQTSVGEDESTNQECNRGKVSNTFLSQRLNTRKCQTS